MPIAGIGWMLAGLWALARPAVLGLVEIWRRASGAYRWGFAHVPDASGPGVVLDADGDPGELHVIARDPVFLPLVGEGRVARVRVRGKVRSSVNGGGLVWLTDSIAVIDLLPGWMQLGPAGDEALAAIFTALTAPVDRLAASHRHVDPRSYALLAAGDPWRAAVVSKVRTLAAAVVSQRRTELEGAVPDGNDDDASDDAAADVGPLDTANSGTPIIDWQSVVDVIAAAAVAAALVDEIEPDPLRGLAAGWVELVGFTPPQTMPQRRSGPSPLKIPRAMMAFVELHSSWSLMLTIAVFFPLVIWFTVVGFLGFLALLVIVGILAIAQGTRRGARIRQRRRRWRPDAGVETAAPATSHVRRAMASVGAMPHPLLARRLTTLLGRSTLWLAVDAPRPADQQRWLQWHKSTAEKIPFLIGVNGAERDMPVFTSANRHARQFRTMWTIPQPASEVMRIARELSVTEIIIDPGCEPSIRMAIESGSGVAVA